MKKYFKHFLWLFIVLGVMLVAFIAVSVTHKKEEVNYTRTNTECLTEERVFDYAGQLTDSEEDYLRKLIAEKEAQIGCDIVLVTLDEPVDSMMNYADDFYDNNQYGYDEPWGDGAIYVANYEMGETWFSTCGRVEDRYSVSMIDRMNDKVCAKLRDDPCGAFETYVNQLVADMEGNGSGEVEVPPAGTAFLFALIVTAIYLGINLFHSKGKKTTVPNTYVEGGRPVIKRNEDIFLHKHVTKRRIESSSGGGGGGGGHHVSSGGHSHGGGGGRF